MNEMRITWTEERVALLRNRVDAGLTCAQIAREIGVSRNAVIGKVSRLGLSRVKSAAVGQPGRTVPKMARPRVVIQQRTSPLAPTTQQLPFAPPAVDNGPRRSLLELAQGHCRWPLSEPGAADFGFCGKEQVEGLSYCAAHARMAYRTGSRMNFFHRAPRVSSERIDCLP
jgi:GcrA cell cycle regulator